MQPTGGVHELVWISSTSLPVSSPWQVHGHIPHVMRAGRAGPEYLASFQLDILCLQSCSLFAQKDAFNQDNPHNAQVKFGLTCHGLLALEI